MMLAELVAFDFLQYKFCKAAIEANQDGGECKNSGTIQGFQMVGRMNVNLGMKLFLFS
jgi:hypothetical protein